MKNRAKCKLCQSTIESFHEGDYVTCTCGQISVSAGLSMECSAIDWANFLRVDDLGNEIIPKVVDKTDDDIKQIYNENPTREDKIKMLDLMIESYENLPDHVLRSPISGYDLVSSLLMISSILKS